MSLTPVALVLLLNTVAPPKVDLQGIVRDPGGAPLKDATVLIFTAQPRKGIGTICPSCYVDCGRQATTDEDGRFRIEKVDGSLLYRIGAVTTTHDPGFASKVDPVEGEAQVTLAPKAPLPDSPRRVGRGRLLDLDGKSVAHAVVAPAGVRVGNGVSYGSAAGAVTITDKDGSFVLVSNRDVDGFIAEVTARGLATTVVEVPSSLEEQTMKIGPGVAVRGRALRNGKPVAGLTFGVVQVERSSDTFVGEATTAVTNAEGRFVLANVIPNDLVAVYSKTLDAETPGGTTLKYVETADHGSVVDLGDLPVSATLHLNGRVVLPDGHSLPPDSAVTVFRQTAFNQVRAPIRDDGTFSVDVISNEPLSVVPGVRGYRLAAKSGRSRRALPLAPLERDRDLSLLLEAEAPKPTK